MAINEWWAGRPDERFWMEITDRDDVGVDLRAPQANGTGGDEWSYTLVAYTQPGDIVLHWHKHAAGAPALIGWSEVVGPLYEDSMDWLAHGTRGRERGRAQRVANWVTPLGGLHEFEHAVTRADLETERTRILAEIEKVQATQGGAVYKPFYLYGGRQIRATQAYLTKFPASLVATVEALAGQAVGAPSLGVPRSATKPGEGRAPSRRQGYLQDAVLRKCIEEYAVARAKAHYENQGAKITTLGKPYDLKVELGSLERHVEVKGTTAEGPNSVVLTMGEVRHARTWQGVDLFVVDGIRYELRDGNYHLSGGENHIWRDWLPADDDLHPTEFSYELQWDAED